MPKFLISIKKYLFTKPKWRFLRIFTKVIKRSSLERIRKGLEEELKTTTDLDNKSFIKGQLSVINNLLE